MGIRQQALYIYICIQTITTDFSKYRSDYVLPKTRLLMKMNLASALRVYVQN